MTSEVALLDLRCPFTYSADNKKRYHVTNNERSLALQGYHELSGDYNKIVEFMKRKAMTMPGNYMEKAKTNENYQTATLKSATKRLQRIVNESLKNTNIHSTSSQTTFQTPSSSQTPGAPQPSMATVIRENKERYSKRSTPEERRASAKFSQAEHLDSPSESEGTDISDSHVPEETVEKTETGKKRAKHGRGKRERKSATEAHKVHTKMCTKAMKLMDRIGVMMDKYESSDSD